MQGLAPSWHPLNLIDEYLFARGWTHNGVGWVAPATMQEAIQMRYGGGSGTRPRAIAISLQVSVDEQFSYATGNSNEDELTTKSE